LREARPLVIAGAAWFLVGVAPLAALLPDWNAWRAWTPSIGFSVAAAAALGAVSPWLAGGLCTIKLVALLAAPTAPATVDKVPPLDGSHVSFRQLVRLQRIVSSTREELRAHVPTLPHGGRISFWELPLLSEFAFQESRALRVWYADSSLVWQSFGGLAGLTRHIDALVEYRFGEARFAAVIPGPAIAEFQRGAQLLPERRYAELEAVLRHAVQLAGVDHGSFYAAVARNLGFSAYGRGAYDEADSLLDLAMDRGPISPDNWVLRAFIAAGRNDRQGATEALRTALTMSPGHPLALELAKALDLHL
jgi:hypothetical protein